MKRIASLLLALCLICPLALLARADGGVSLTLAFAEGRVGEEVEIPLTLADNPGIISLQAKVKYDEEKLELLSVKDGGILGKEIKHQPEKTSPYTLSWENYLSKENFTANGVLCTLVFRIQAGEAGEEIPVTLTVEDYGVMNTDLKDLPRRLTSGGVIVSDASPASFFRVAMPWFIAGGCLILAGILAGVTARVVLTGKGKEKRGK